MRWNFSLDDFLRLFFIAYCVQAGYFLAVEPWRDTWDRVLLHLTYLPLRELLMHPLCRGAATGFGLVHLVWGAHDLESWLLRRGLYNVAAAPMGASEKPLSTDSHEDSGQDETVHARRAAP